MEELELIAFQIISAVGTARSCYIEAIQAAKHGQFARAEALIAEGDKSFAEGHATHTGLLTKEAANGPGCTLSLLILHAEDQLMSAEGFKIIALESPTPMRTPGLVRLKGAPVDPAQATLASIIREVTTAADFQTLQRNR